MKKNEKLFLATLFVFLLSAVFGTIQVNANVATWISMEYHDRINHQASMTVSSVATHGVNGMEARITNINTGARTAWTQATQTNNFPTGRRVNSDRVRTVSGQRSSGEFNYRRQGTTAWRALPTREAAGG